MGNYSQEGGTVYAEVSNLPSIKDEANNAGLYLPLLITSQLWVDVNMDFMMGLPCTDGDTSVHADCVIKRA